ncbi:hypothetical protein [Paenibacillus caui]|uniref:hypothetical protein n=1 Tax=Paenibacillus caui TaxID=2873927 RepID=UPI001CA86B44|nr:hypothetical protein [Paenibacillus caui]
MTKDKHQKRERQIASNNGQSDTAGSRGELQSGRLSQFKNHSLGDGGAPNEYLNSESEKD